MDGPSEGFRRRLKNIGGPQVAVEYPCIVHFFDSENLEEAMSDIQKSEDDNSPVEG